MLKKLLSKTSFSAVIVMGGLLSTSCGDTVYESVKSPSVTISQQSVSENSITVTFTPNEATSRFTFILTDDHDLDKYMGNDFGEGQTEAGSSPLTHTFEGLEKDKEYVIYARPYDQGNATGPLASLRIKTFNGTASASVHYTTELTAGLQVKMDPEYYYRMVYALGTAEDRENFLAGSMDLTERVDISVYTQNYFDLEPGKEYVFYAQCYDRIGRPSPLFEVPFRTLERGSGPAVDFTVNHSDILLQQFTITPNDLTGRISVHISILDSPTDYSNIIYGEGGYKGDLLNFMEVYTRNGWTDAVHTDKSPLSMQNYTTELMAEATVEVYVLVYDLDSEPYSVQKFDIVTPAAENPGTARVELTVTDITASGATYTFTPNEDTFMYFFETFYADEYEPLFEMEGFYEEMIHEYLYSYLPYYPNGTYWVYPAQTSVFVETQAIPDSKFYAVVCPLSRAGRTIGWGPHIAVEYTTLSE